MTLFTSNGMGFSLKMEITTYTSLMFSNVTNPVIKKLSETFFNCEDGARDPRL